MPVPKKPLSERFWPKVNKTETCWLWTAAKHEFGYGVIGCPDRKGKNLKAHRVSYYLHYGPIPFGMSVLHRCDVPQCVNPYHLFLGTQRDNVDDMIDKGRFGAIGNGKGENSPNSKLTWDQVTQIRELYKIWFSMESLSGMFPTSKSNIKKIISLKIWKTQK